MPPLATAVNWASVPGAAGNAGNTDTLWAATGAERMVNVPLDDHAS